MSESTPDIIVARAANPGDYPRTVCGATGRAALDIHKDDGSPPWALCHDCSADREQVAALVRDIRSRLPVAE